MSIATIGAFCIGEFPEAVAKTEIVVFDKTGTLTKDVFEVQKVNPINVSKEKLIKLAAHAEGYSNHPISLSLKKA